MKKLIFSSILTLLVFMSAFFSCRQVVIPRPRGYFRIDLPEHHYALFNGLASYNNNMPFSFEYPDYGQLEIQNKHETDLGWLNIEFPSFKAKIYLTYKDINNDFEGLMEQTYKMNVKNHISKADAINEMLFDNEQNKVYGVLYDLKGNTASAVQFYVTDSINHYLRGSLYFSSEPNADSLEPVIRFFREDIVHLIETLKWEK